MKFTLKELSEKYKTSYKTIENWNAIGRDKILNDLAKIDLFIQKTDFTKKDFEAVKQLLNKSEDYTLKRKAREAEQKLFEYFHGIKNFELAVELYSLNLKKEELKNLYRLLKSL